MPEEKKMSGGLEEYSDESDIEVLDLEQMDDEMLESTYKNAMQDKNWELAVDIASTLLERRGELCENDALSFELGRYYLMYGDALLKNFEYNSEMLSSGTGALDGPVPGASMKEKMENLLKQVEADPADEQEDAIAFEMLELARSIFAKKVEAAHPNLHLNNEDDDFSNLAAASIPGAESLRAEEGPESPEDNPELWKNSEPPAGEISDVLQLSLCHRRLGELYLAQDLHKEALGEFRKSFFVIKDGVHPVHARQSAVLLAQSLQWTGHHQDSMRVYEYALRLYRFLAAGTEALLAPYYLPSGPKVYISSKETIEDLGVLLADLKPLVESHTKKHAAKQSKTDSPNARLAALQNSLPGGTLESAEGTKTKFDDSQFSAVTVSEMSPVRRKRPLSDGKEGAEDKKQKVA